MHYIADALRDGRSPLPDVAVIAASGVFDPNRDPFAHFLRAGTYGDRDPSPDFDAAAYRKRVLGRPSRHFRRLLHPERDNPLVHWLGVQYEATSNVGSALG
jgi:hypothetical protein